MVAKKTPSKSEKPMTKTGFVKGFGPDLPAEEIIAKGKDAGLDLTKKYVWTLQSEMRKAAGGPMKYTKTSPKKKTVAGTIAKKSRKGSSARSAQLKASTMQTKASAPAVHSTGSTGANAEQKMRALIVELGTARAEEVYRAMKTQLDAIASGA